MAKEYFIDRIGNISVQGPVVCIDMGRMVASQSGDEATKLENRLTITMTGQNFVNLVNTLNGTVKAISERHREQQASSQKSDPDSSSS